MGKRIRSDKDRERDRRRYAREKDDPEFRLKEQLRAKKYYEDNKEKKNERSKSWYAANRDKALRISNDWNESHPSRRREIKSKSDAKKRRSPASVTKHDAYYYIEEYRAGRISFDEFVGQIGRSYVRANERLKRGRFGRRKRSL